MTKIAEPPHPELDKEEQARKLVPGQYRKFRAWMQEQGWTFCIAGDHKFVPAPWHLVDQVAIALGIEGEKDQAGSQKLGEFLEECIVSGLTICVWKESSREELAERRKQEYERKEITYFQYRDLVDWPNEDPDYYPAAWYSVSGTINDHLAKFFGVDRKKADEEREAILDAFRRAQGLA